MAKTNFAALTEEQYTAWGMSFWHHARNNAFISRFMGKGPNAMIQHITELTKSKKGVRAVLTLLADMTGDGVVGDTRLEDSEEALNSFDTVITFDQMRNANRLEGRMADQRSIVNFRNTSKDALGYWLSDRLDQLAFLSLASMPYTRNTNGSLRPVLPAGKNFSDLEFAPDSATAAPSARRGYHLKASGITSGTGFDAADGALTPLDYKALVRLKALAKDNYIRPIKSGGEETYHVFVTPQGMADLRLDTDFLANIRNAGVRGDSNPLFSGASSVNVDGLIVHEYRHVFNTVGAAAGDGFGSTVGNDKGQRAMLCGAQALGMADIGTAEWVERDFDYGSENGISVAKMVGFLKPQFKGNLSSPAAKEDFGVITLDTALSFYS
jgi:N4-gp56 family major capsid protein